MGGRHVAGCRSIIGTINLRGAQQTSDVKGTGLLEKPGDSVGFVGHHIVRIAEGYEISLSERFLKTAIEVVKYDVKTEMTARVLDFAETKLYRSLLGLFCTMPMQGPMCNLLQWLQRVAALRPS